MKHLYSINRGPNETPQESFDRLCESTNGTPLVFKYNSNNGGGQILYPKSYFSKINFHTPFQE